VALVALAGGLYPQEWRTFLASAWQAGPIDDRERLTLAEAMLALGDRRGRDDLVDLCGHDDPEIAARARSALESADSGESL
jgi:hypothetical protein